MTKDFRNRQGLGFPKEIKIVDIHKFLNQILANSLQNDQLTLPEINRWLDGIQDRIIDRRLFFNEI